MENISFLIHISCHLLPFPARCILLCILKTRSFREDVLKELRLPPSAVRDVAGVGGGGGAGAGGGGMDIDPYQALKWLTTVNESGATYTTSHADDSADDSGDNSDAGGGAGGGVAGGVAGVYRDRFANLTNFDLSAAMIEVTLPVDFAQLLLLREIASRSKYRDSYGFRVSGDSLVLQDSTDHVYVERDGRETGERWERDGGGRLDRERDSETVRQ